MSAAPSIVIEDLVVEFKKPRSLVDFISGSHPPAVRAVDGVSLTVEPGETLGLVGESGSGKSTIGRAILGLNRPARGSIRFEGKTFVERNAAEQADFRRRVQMVFQDPYSSLNPRLKISGAIAEVLRFHRIVPETGIPAESSACWRWWACPGRWPNAGPGS